MKYIRYYIQLKVFLYCYSFRSHLHGPNKPNLPKEGRLKKLTKHIQEMSELEVPAAMPEAIRLNPDSKIPLELLMRLQTWINTEFKQLLTTIQTDVANCQYLRVVRSTPHPALVTQPSLQLVCRVTTTYTVSCLVQSFNLVTIKEIQASFNEESKVNPNCCISNQQLIHRCVTQCTLRYQT